MIPDPVQAVMSLLLADADTVALVGAHVYGAELPAAEAKQDYVAALVVKAAGGGMLPQGWAEWGDQRLDVLCFAETPYEAGKLYRTIYPVLKQLGRSVQDGCLLHWAKLAGGPISTRDPNTRQPFVLTSWQVLVSEVTAA